MIYTKPIPGRSQLVTVTDAKQTLKELLAATGGGEIDPEANEILIDPVELPLGLCHLAWPTFASEHNTAVDNGIAYFVMLPIVITKAQYEEDGFSIVKNGGADKLFYIEQYDSESFSL